MRRICGFHSDPDQPTLTRWSLQFLLLSFSLAGTALCSNLAAQEERIALSETPVVMGDGADELFQRITAGYLLPDGRVAIADGEQGFVRIYSPEGERFVEVGGAGEGPGEFLAIRGLWAGEEGGVVAWDPRLERASRFGPEGALRSSRRVGEGAPVSPGNLELFFGSFRNGDLLLGRLQSGSRPATGQIVHDRVVLSRFGAEGEYRGSIAETSGLYRAGRAPIPFSPFPRGVVRGDSLWLADPYDPRITVLDAKGSQVREIELTDLPAHEGEGGATMQALEAELERGERSFYLEILDETPAPERFPAIAGMLLDEEAGQVWVKAYEPPNDALWLREGSAVEVGPGGHWLVLDGEGRTRFRVDVPEELELLDVRGGRILAIQRDEWGVETAVVHGLER